MTATYEQLRDAVLSYGAHHGFEERTPRPGGADCAADMGLAVHNALIHCAIEIEAEMRVALAEPGPDPIVARAWEIWRADGPPVAYPDCLHQACDEAGMPWK